MIVNRRLFRFRRWPALVPCAMLPALACGPRETRLLQSERPAIAVTIHPLRLIVREITGHRAAITLLIPLGASPHGYEPRPSEARALQDARLLIYTDDHLDGWAGDAAPGDRIEIMALLHPDGRDESVNPHFWTDPGLVKRTLEPIAAALGKIDPDGEEYYYANAAAFARNLDRLDAQVQSMLEPVKGRAVIQFHPSFDPYFERYGLTIAGVIEPAPGREPTPREFQQLIDSAKSKGARAVVTEPQLPRRPAEALAEATGLPLLELDPLGDRYGSDSYGAWLMINTRQLAEGLK